MQKLRRRTNSLAAFGAALVLLAGAAHAEEDVKSSSLSIELNQAASIEDACRLTFVVRNEMEGDIDKLVAETVLFTNTGKVALITLFDFASIPVGKPRVRQFDVPANACSDLKQVLINGWQSCSVQEGAPNDCAKNFKATYLTEIELIG